MNNVWTTDGHINSEDKIETKGVNIGNLVNAKCNGHGNARI